MKYWLFFFFFLKQSHTKQCSRYVTFSENHTAGVKGRTFDALHHLIDVKHQMNKKMSCLKSPPPTVAFTFQL